MKNILEKHPIISIITVIALYLFGISLYLIYDNFLYSFLPYTAELIYSLIFPLSLLLYGYFTGVYAKRNKLSGLYHTTLITLSLPALASFIIVSASSLVYNIDSSLFFPIGILLSPIAMPIIYPLSLLQETYGEITAIISLALITLFCPLSYKLTKPRETTENQ